MAAFRTAVVLHYTGVRDVRVLHGGVQAWTAAGYALETTTRHHPTPTADFGGTVPRNPHVVDTMAAVRKGLTSPETFTLVDNRSWREHVGEASGYEYHSQKGRVPGAVYGDAGLASAYGMEHYRNPDNCTMRNPNESLALWRAQGIDTSKHLSLMCGSGWRVAEIFSTPPWRAWRTLR